MFLSLDEVASNLPPLTEHVLPVSMDGDIAREYDRVEKALRSTMKELGPTDRRLMGPMLTTLLSYPDYPFNREPVGYWNTDKATRQRTSFTPVVTPKSHEPNGRVYRKEQQLLDLVLEEKAQGRQCWVFVQYTDKYDVAGRLEHIFQTHGLRAKVLRADKVEPKKREAWIAKHAPGCDVMISHPQPVETGLDLFCKSGGHNFVTLLFYQTGFNLFVLRQASRRAWRIGQKEPCKVFYLFYKNSAQAHAMELIARKMTAAEAVEGKFSTEGLVAMAGENDSAEVALARSLVEKMDDAQTQRAWEKLATVEGSHKPSLATTNGQHKKRKRVMSSERRRQAQADVALLRERIRQVQTQLKSA